MTNSQIVNEVVQAKIRKDGLSLCKVEIWHTNGAHGVEYYDPHTAQIIKHDVEFSGGKCEVTKVR